MPDVSRPFLAVDALLKSIRIAGGYDERCMSLVRLALGRAIVNDDVDIRIIVDPAAHPERVVEYRARDEVPPNSGRALLEDGVLRNVLHVVDWIVASIRDDAPWLARTDAMGRPLKLMKIGSMERAVAEADKAMRRFAAGQKKLMLVDGAEAIHAEFEDGWYLVRLLTPEALDRESGHMQHCIGQGAYDARLAIDKHVFLSLRDPHGKPHVTIEIHDRTLKQFSGKQNKRPIERYVEMLRPWLRTNLDADPKQGHYDHHWWSGGVLDSAGKLHDPAALPANFESESMLLLEPRRSCPLPDEMVTVLNGKLSIQHVWPDERYEYTAPMTMRARYVELQGAVGPYGTDARGRGRFRPGSIVDAETIELNHSVITGFGDVGTNCRNMVLNSSEVDEIPEEIVLERLSISKSRIHKLPSKASIDVILISRSDVGILPEGIEFEELDIYGCDLFEVPPGMDCRVLKVYDSVVTGVTSETKIRGKLYISGAGCSIDLPEDFEVGELTIGNCPDWRLPEGMVVRGNADLRGYPHALPERLKVGGTLRLDGRHVDHLPDGLEVGDGVSFVTQGDAPTIGPDAVIGKRLELVRENKSEFIAVSDLVVVGHAPAP